MQTVVFYSDSLWLPGKILSDGNPIKSPAVLYIIVDYTLKNYNIIERICTDIQDSSDESEGHNETSIVSDEQRQCADCAYLPAVQNPEIR